MSRFARMHAIDRLRPRGPGAAAVRAQPAAVFDRETLAILIVDCAAVHQYRHSREELLGMSVTEPRPPEDRERFMARIEQGPPWAKVGGGRHQKKDGAIIHGISQRTVEAHRANMMRQAQPARAGGPHPLRARRRPGRD